MYEQFKSTLQLSLLILVAATLLLLFVLRMILKPLQAITRQADDISAGKFTIIDELPWTREVRSVANSMNSMSTKIGQTIQNLNSRLDKLNDELKRDPLTQLFNQTTFDVDMKQMLLTGEAGYVIYIKLDDLSAIIQKHGKHAVDNLLKSFADELQQLPFADLRCYRWYGSEFAVVQTEADINDVNALAQQIQLIASRLGEQYDQHDLLHMGIVPFARHSEFERLQPALVEACKQALLIGENAYFIKQDTLSSMNDIGWKTTIERVIAEDEITISFTNAAYSYDDNLQPRLVMREAFTDVRDKTGQALPIGTLFSMAEAFGASVTLDQYIVRKVLQQLSQEATPAPVMINLSRSALSSTEFQQWLTTEIRQSNNDPAQLAFGVSAYIAAKDLDAYRQFSQFVRQLGAASLLKRYSSDVIPVDMLKDLQIDYIRLARELTRDIHNNTHKADLLNTIQQVASLIEVRVLAESVVNDDDFQWLRQAGLFGISR